MSNRNRPVRKRTNLVREEQLLQIAGMHLENLSQRVIAARLRLSQSQICRDLKEIKRRWQSAHRQELATLQAPSPRNGDSARRRGFRLRCHPGSIRQRDRPDSGPAAGFRRARQRLSGRCEP